MTDKLETIKEALNGYNRAKLNNDISNWLHINTDLFVDLLNSYMEDRTSKDMVERVAKVLHKKDVGDIGYDCLWSEAFEDTQRSYIKLAKEVIEAMEGGE